MAEDNKHIIEGDDGGGRAVNMSIELPSNSKKSKRVTVTDLKSAKDGVPQKVEKSEENEERPRLEKVVENAAIRKKKGFGHWLKTTFMGEDARSVARHVGSDVLVPAIKDLFADLITQSTQRLLFGESAPRGRSSRYDEPRDRPHTPYGKMSISSGGSSRRQISQRSRAAHDFDDIVLTSRNEAQDVLWALKRRIDSYGSATVADLYDLVDISGEFTDDKWGWFDLHDSGIRRSTQGYILVLPRPEVIE